MIIVKNRLNAGWECHQRGELEQAEAIYRSVVADFPKRADAWIYFGMSLNDQARFDEALAAYERALALSPDNESAWTNRGNTLGMLGRPQASLQSHRKALSLSPQYARAHTNLGVQLLRTNQLQAGWQEYEWRTKTGVFSPPECRLPLWHGESLKNKHLLIHGEQGLGDEIQTARYVSQVVDQGGRATLTADSKLQALFTTSFPEADIARRGQQLPAADYQICGLNLPQHFGHGRSRAYLSVEAKKQAAWKADLCRFERLKIGISWCGNPQNPMNMMRSLQLEEIMNAIPKKMITVVSLQAIHGQQELNELQSDTPVYRPLEVLKPGTPPMSIDEMAALISCLDLVITCDSVCAHLAPALGIETWLLLCRVPDWRWGVNGHQSPWYNSVRLFRQQRQGDWRDVCRQINYELDRKLSDIRSPNDHPMPAVEKILADNIERKNCRHGNFYYLSTDRYIGESLRQYGEFSEQEVELFDQLLRPGDTVIEVGSNIGTHTIPLGKIVGPSGKVLAFEPQHYVFELLRLNVEANDLSQVSVNRAALGEISGEITVPLLDPSFNNNFGGVPLGEQDTGEVVPISTVDELSIDRCALLKADVEGMEAAVIKGAIETIKRLQPILYLENDRKEKSAELISLIRELGYRIYLHTPALYKPDNYFNNLHNVFGDIRSLNILCFPKAAKISISGLKELT